MKAISLWQPWASLIGRGKSIETRSWGTSYRGPLRIHAAKHWSPELERLCQREPFASALCLDLLPHPDNVRALLPRGALVAVCTLADCQPMWVGTGDENCPETHYNWHEASEQEIAFGDWRPGRFAWRLENIQILPGPIPFRGRQGLFDVPLSALGDPFHQRLE